MSYSTSVLVHEDVPRYGLLFRLIIVAVPGIFLISGIYLWFQGDAEGSRAMLSGIILIGLVFWAVFPRKYQIFQDHLRIVLGGPLALRISFNNIEKIGVTSTHVITVNFVTAVTRSYVEIVRKKGLAIVITPRDNDSFIESANRALGEWARQSASPNPGGS